MIDVYTYRDILLVSMGIGAGALALFFIGWLVIESIVGSMRSKRRIAEAHRQLAALTETERVALNRYLAGVGSKP